MWPFLIFIIFLIVFSYLSKVLEQQQEKEKIEKQPSQIGLPLLEEARQPKPQIITIKEALPEAVQIQEKIQEEAEEPSYFSMDKLEEGIILSIILGPPKADQLRRGGGIGIHAGLKNR